MSTLYFSGIEKAATAQVLAEVGAAGMMNRLQYSESLMAACDDCHLQNLVMDCGSFTRPLTPEEIVDYSLLIQRLGDRFIWYANPDVIGNQEQSYINYRYLLSLLPEGLHDRVLYIYQYGADLSYLYQALEQHQRIGIGGLVPLIQSDRIKALHVIVQLADIIARYGVTPHFFGLSTLSIIDALHNHLSDYSVDSTTWLAGSRYGLLINSRGQQHAARELGYDFDRDSILKQNIRTMRKWVEGPVKTKQQQISATLQLSLDLFTSVERPQPTVVKESA
jgi:hypothetical protein